jgi:hypothetical protein
MGVTTVLLVTLMLGLSTATLQFARVCGETCINSCCSASTSLGAVLTVNAGACYAMNGTWDGGASGFNGGSFRSFLVTGGAAMVVSWYEDATCTQRIALGPSDPKGCSTLGRCCSFMFELHQGGVWYDTSITLSGTTTYSYYGLDMGASYGDCPNVWLSPTIIAAAAVGGAALVAVIIICIVCCCRRCGRCGGKQKQQHRHRHHHDQSRTQPTGYTPIPSVVSDGRAGDGPVGTQHGGGLR